MQTLAEQDTRVADMMKLEEIFHSNPDLVREYQQREQDRLDYRLSLEASEKRGRRDGIAIGRQDGIAIGEDRARHSIMERLIAGGISPQQAAAFTGLSV